MKYTEGKGRKIYKRIGELIKKGDWKAVKEAREELLKYMKENGIEKGELVKDRRITEAELRRTFKGM